MKNYQLTFSLAICVLMISIMSLIGCSTYSEGDEIAERIFKKMTVQEKTLYDAVEKEWGQSYLLNVRKAVQNRDIAPRETMMPFRDIAALIKTNNDVTLKLSSGWNTDHKNRAIKSRWDLIDSDWYRDLLSSIGITNYTVQELIPEEVEEVVVEEVPLKVAYEPIIEQIVIKPIDPSSIVSMDEYDKLFYKIRGCNEALEYYNEVLEQRLITYKDQVILIQLATKCKAIQIGEKLTEWKN